MDSYASRHMNSSGTTPARLRWRTPAAVAAAAAMLFAVQAGPAAAVKPIQKTEHYSGHDGFDMTDCGLDLHVEVDFGGVASIRPAPGSTEAFLAHDNYWFAEKITLAGDEDGPFVTTQGNGNLREQKAVLLDPAKPNIYQFSIVDAGTFRLYDSDGNQLAFGRGNAKITQVFDTGGDGQPGGVEISSTVIEHGPFTGDFCAAIVSELT